MISHISGTLIETHAGAAVIDIGGLGYKVETNASLPEIGDEVSFWTYLAVRENAMNLFGFSSKEELVFFENLIAVPGIGPKSGLAILSLATVETLKQSISSNDITYLTKVSGIGKKSAQKIVLELKDKLDDDINIDPNLKRESDVVEALKSLGYSLKESREALKEVSREVTGTNERIKAALKILGK